MLATSALSGRMASRSSLLLAAVAGVSLGAAYSAQAEVILTPRFRPSIVVNDNRRMKSEDPSGQVASVNEISLETQYMRPTYSLGLVPLYRVTRNSNQKELDSEDYFFDASGQKLFERHRFGIELGYERELSANTEFDEAGTIDVAVPQISASFNGSWIYEATERLQVTTFGGYTDVSFTQSGPTNLVDYTYASVGANIDYAVNDQTVLLGRSSASLFETPTLRSETLSYTYQFGVQHSFSETLNTELLFGQNIGRSKSIVDQNVLVSLVPLVFGTETVTQRGRSAGRITSALVEKRFSRDRIEINWSQFVGPSSLGSRQQRERVNARVIHDFSESWRGQINFGYDNQEQESVAGVSVRPLQRLVTGASIGYRLTSTMTIRLDYRFVHQERIDIGATAEANRISLAFVYNGDPQHYFQ